MRNVVVVGTGDHFAKNLAPSLNLMQQEGLANVIATVDVHERPKTSLFGSAEHRVRKPLEELGHLLFDLKPQTPVVMFGHSNEMHEPDAFNAIMNGFDAIVEKPYCVDRLQLMEMKAMVESSPKNVSLMEYYLMMKAIPLLIAAGTVNKDSFYFSREGTLKPCGWLKKPADISGRLKEMIGKPRYVLVDVLEGEGDYGKVDHRGISLVDKRKGGGMIQDLGIHVVSPLFALENYLGNIDPTFSLGKVNVATCKDYAEMAKQKFNLPEENIGETYAEIETTTSKGVPVQLSLGKYTPKNKNQRRIVIVGSGGEVAYDLTNNALGLSQGDENPTQVLECPKTGAKYYPVVRSSLEIIQGNNPYTFDPNKVALNSQEFVLNALRRSEKPDKTAVYDWGTSPENIF